MKLLLLSLADLSTSTADAITTLKTARALADEGFEVSVLAPRQPHTTLAIEPGPVTVLRHFNLRALGLPNTLNTLVQLLMLPLLVRRHRLNVVYVRAAMFTFTVGLWGRLNRRVRVVSEHHGWTATERLLRGGSAMLAAWEARVQVWDARAADRVRTVVPGIRDRLAAAGVDPARVVVVGNACDTGFIVPQKRTQSLQRFDLDPDALHFGFLGSLTAWQGMEDVISAFAESAREYPAVRLLVVGDGPLKQTLQDQARTYDVVERVHFLGRIDHHDVPAVLGCFDVALLPTAAGGYAEIGRSPLKLREYAAAGRAVLAARIPAIEELASESWLHLYRPGDVADLARAIGELAQAPAELAAAGAAARSYAEQHFSWPAIMRRITRELGLDAGASLAARTS